MILGVIPAAVFTYDRYNAVDTDEFAPEARLALREEMRTRWHVPENATCLLFLGHNFRLNATFSEIDEATPNTTAVPLTLSRSSGANNIAPARVSISGCTM